MSGGHGAKRTVEGTAARGLDHPFDEKAVGQKIVARCGDMIQFLRHASIDRFQFPTLGILEQFRPDRFRLADHDRIEIMGGFLLRIGDVRPAAHNELAARTIVPGQPVGFRGEPAEEADRHQVSLGFGRRSFQLAGGSPGLDGRLGVKAARWIPVIGGTKSFS